MHINRHRRPVSSAEGTSYLKRHKSSPMPPAPAAPAASAAVAPDPMQVLNDDMILCITTFASCRDLCVLGRVCRRFSPLPFHEDIWELRALDILPSLPEIRSAMDALKLTSCRQLVEAFTRIGIPGGVLGFWQAETSAAPPSDFSPTLQELEARGELLRITLEAGGFLCESIAPNGTRRRVFTVRVSKTATNNIKIGFFSLEKESSLTVGGEDDSWVPGDSMAEALARYTLAVPGSTERTPIRASGARAFLLEREDGSIRRYAKLTAPKPSPLPSPATCPTGPLSLAVGGGVEHLCGLWCAPYGSHGLEIIQLSTEPSSSPSAGAAEAAAEAAAAATAAEKAAAEKAKPSCCSRAWCAGDGAGSSCAMTEDGSESACTSAPATDGEDRSEAGSCYGESGGWADASAGFDAASDDDDVASDDDSDGARDRDRDPDCPSAMTKEMATAKRKKRGYRQGVAVAQQPCVSPSPNMNKNDDPPVASSPSQLFGFKVTGDDNVPAGKTSFVIDLTTEFDVDEELRSDSRPLVMFLPSGAVMANLANRREQISRWRKGRGQINRVPGRWSPEWVDVEFVEYLAGSRCAFSVIFRQPTQAVRVVMNFERALGAGSKEEWPQWSAAAAAAVDPLIACGMSSA